MKAFLFKTLVGISFVWGSWFIRFFAWWVASGYFLFCSSRRGASVQLYRNLFPQRSLGHAYYCAWRQFHSFAATYGDRIELDGRKGILTSTEGREGLVSAAKRGAGGILIMSHLGSYEVAARAFQELGLKLLLLMGEKEAKQVARAQREALHSRGISILVATGQEDSLWEGLEAIQFIREGGFVSLSGDLVWTKQRSLISVSLFNQAAEIPSGPHLLALVSGAPLFTLFTCRINRGSYRIIISPPRLVKASSRSERNRVLQASAQTYATELEKIVAQHPFQWYIFEPFFRSSLSRIRKNPDWGKRIPEKIGEEL
jgi:predicted LPLAT superfamily acyltransferase